MYRQSDKLVKQRYLLHMPSQYDELRPINGQDRLAGLGHTSKSQRVSRFRFVTAATSLNGSQPNFARCLSVSWAGTLYIHSWGLLPLTEFCHVQNSLCIQVFVLYGSVIARHSSSGRQPNFAGWYKEWNYGTFAYGATYIRLVGHYVEHRPTFLVVNASKPLTYTVAKEFSPKSSSKLSIIDDRYSCIKLKIYNVYSAISWS